MADNAPAAAHAVTAADAVTAAAKPMTEDELKLAKLGYRQELDRSLHWFHNFGISFTIISVPTGICPLIGYSLGMVDRFRLRLDRGGIHVRDCQCVPDLGRALLVGRQAGRREVRTSGFVDHGLVQPFRRGWPDRRCRLHLRDGARRHRDPCQPRHHLLPARAVRLVRRRADRLRHHQLGRREDPGAHHDRLGHLPPRLHLPHRDLAPCGRGQQQAAGQLGLPGFQQHHGLRRRLRRPPRPAHLAVDLLGLRRLGPPVGGDQVLRLGRRQGHHERRLGLLRGRLVPHGRHPLRHPQRRGCARRRLLRNPLRGPRPERRRSHVGALLLHRLPVHPGLHHQQLAHDLRLFEGRRAPRQQMGPPHRPPHPHPRPRRHRVHLPRAASGPAFHRLERRADRADLDRHRRAVPLLRFPHFPPHHHRQRNLQAGPLQHGQVLDHRRLDRCDLGRIHHRRLLPSQRVPRHGDQLQLRARARGRRHHVRRDLLARFGAQVVQGAHHADLGGGAGGDGGQGRGGEGMSGACAELGLAWEGAFSETW